MIESSVLPSTSTYPILSSLSPTNHTHPYYIYLPPIPVMSCDYITYSATMIESSVAVYVNLWTGVIVLLSSIVMMAINLAAFIGCYYQVILPTYLYMHIGVIFPFTHLYTHPYTLSSLISLPSSVATTRSYCTHTFIYEHLGHTLFYTPFHTPIRTTYLTRPLAPAVSPPQPTPNLTHPLTHLLLSFRTAHCWSCTPTA